MSQNPHERAAELHNLAAHAHLTAAASHDKADHLRAHELSQQAHEHSTKALEQSKNAAASFKPGKELSNAVRSNEISTTRTRSSQHQRRSTEGAIGGPIDSGTARRTEAALQGSAKAALNQTTASNTTRAT